MLKTAESASRVLKTLRYLGQTGRSRVLKQTSDQHVVEKVVLENYASKLEKSFFTPRMQ
jgi:hypothetical protein